MKKVILMMAFAIGMTGAYAQKTVKVEKTGNDTEETTDSGETEVIQTGEHADALAYELADMEKAIRGDAECMHLDYTKDVMDMMTEFRKAWKFTYPEEE